MLFGGVGSDRLVSVTKKTFEGIQLFEVSRLVQVDTGVVVIVCAIRSFYGSFV